ncbi:TIM barrel protein [Bacillus cereus]|uniref:sugar phosphate isomerase/epimerase family protein n=1 Tax=Bacillus TaxID=1386 RepID=UPI00054EBD17|nr:sugar phosphate isomerase/epimerase family protein [Bacillus sp. UNC322MFChir4.1]
MIKKSIKLSGIADEAGSSIESQIKAHLLLGWDEIELRSIEGIALAEVDHIKFQKLKSMIHSSHLKVTTVSSTIGNWDKPITTEFFQDKEELKVLSDRMHQLGSTYLRIMSYPNDGMTDYDWKERVLERISILTELAEKENVILVHENCAGWAGQSAMHTLEMLEKINSDSLKVLFDIGNGVSYGYESLDFLKKVHPFTVHVHVKDSLRREDNTVIFTFPGEGNSNVLSCLQFLFDKGYEGILAIEPHIHLIPHLRNTLGETNMLSSYIRYGRALREIIEQDVKIGGY